MSVLIPNAPKIALVEMKFCQQFERLAESFSWLSVNRQKSGKCNL